MLTSLLPLLIACSGGATAVTGPDGASAGGVKQVMVRPSEVTLEVGDTAHLRVRGRNDKGHAVSLSARDVTWESSGPKTASVDSTGLVEAHKDGRVQITATFRPGKSERSMRDSARIVAKARSGGGDGSGTTADSMDPFRAFPEAEGWGAEALTQCDRSEMQVLHVTNLQDSGSGSLRDAVRKVRPDILSVVVFRVAGYIDISTIDFKDWASCLYIAGQTAPGDGVTVRAFDNPAFVFRSGPVHDVVIRYLRLRNGTRQPGKNTTAQGIIIGSGERVVLDHLSLSWANDQLLSIYMYRESYGWGPVRNISVQRSLFAEPLASSPVCYSTKGDVRGESDGVPDWYEVENVTLHHNAALHCSHRAPMISSKNADVINNVVYNWNQGAMHTSRKASADYIGNYFKRGPMNRPLDTKFAREFSHDFRTNTSNSKEPDGYRIIGNTENIDRRAGPSVYLSGNIGPNNSTAGRDNWAMTSKYKNNEDLPESLYNSIRYSEEGLMPLSVDGVRLRRESRHDAPPTAVTVQSASQAWNSLIENGDVGANRRLTCAGDWVEIADGVDRRLLAEARNGSGRGSSLDIESQAEVGGFPELKSGSPCPDSDKDGMPDQFEAGFGLDPRDPSDATADDDDDGYTNLEEYVNGTVPR